MAYEKRMSSGGSGSASTSSHFPNVVSVSAWYGSISCSSPTWRAASRFTLEVSVLDASIACALRPAIVEAKARKWMLCG